MHFPSQYLRHNIKASNPPRNVRTDSILISSPASFNKFSKSSQTNCQQFLSQNIFSILYREYIFHVVFKNSPRPVSFYASNRGQFDDESDWEYSSSSRMHRNNLHRNHQFSPLYHFGVWILFWLFSSNALVRK